MVAHLETPRDGGGRPIQMKSSTGDGVGRRQAERHCGARGVARMDVTSVTLPACHVGLRGAVRLIAGPTAYRHRCTTTKSRGNGNKVP